MEIAVKALQHEHGDHVRIGFVMGGLVEDVNRFHDPSNRIGGGAEAMDRQFAAHWIEASQHNGIPIGTKRFAQAKAPM